MKKILFLILLILPTFSSLLRAGFYPMHDDMQAMRLLQIDKCIKDAQIPCRWVPDMGFGYGYPQFNYYAPLPYYFMELIHLAGFDILTSVKIGFISGLVIGVIGIYLLSSFLWGKYAGLLSAILYSYLPYRAVNMYVRGAMGELWGMALLPFVFWSSLKLIRKEKNGVLVFTLTLSSLLVSHNITALISMPLLIFWFLILFVVFKSSLLQDFTKILKNIFLGLFWAVGISSFFIFPAWFEKNLVHINTMTSGYFNYINHFVGINQLLISNYWGYGVSEYGPYDEILLSIGIWYWVLPFISLILIFVLKRKKDAVLLVFLILVGWLSLFLVHPRSQPIWDRISILKLFQFPWRFLAISGFFFSISAGYLGSIFKSFKTFFLFSILPLMTIFLIYYSSFFKPSEWLQVNEREKFSNQEWIRQQTVSIYDYLPISAKKAPDFPATDNPKIEEGEVSFGNFTKGSNWVKWNLNVLSEKVKLTLPLYYFPNFEVMVDENKVPFDFDNENGLISLEVKNGRHEVYARLEDTPIRSYSNLISLVSIILVPVYLTRKNNYEL